MSRERKRAYDRAYHEAHGERKRAYARAYYEANRERKRAYDRVYREANRERRLAYRSAYGKANLFNVAGMTFNRRTDPPELIAIAERIKATKALLKGKGTPNGR